MNSKLAFYMTRIQEAANDTELNYIVEQAAFDLSNNADYETVYNAAMTRLLDMLA